MVWMERKLNERNILHRLGVRVGEMNGVRRTFVANYGVANHAPLVNDRERTEKQILKNNSKNGNQVYPADLSPGGAVRPGPGNGLHPAGLKFPQMKLVRRKNEHTLRRKRQK